MTVQIKDIDELARAGQIDKLVEVPYVPDKDATAAKEESFPFWALPSPMRGIVGECGRVHKTQALPAICSLVAAGNMPGHGLRLKTWQGMSTSPNLHAIAAADSGTGKSLTMNEIISPIKAMERELSKSHNEGEASRDAERDILKADIARLLKTKVKDHQEVEHSKQRLAEIEAESTPPLLIVQDITTENLGTKLGENGEVLLSASTECARIFDELKGGYGKSQTPRDDLWNACYSGESYTVHRGSRPPVNLENPALSICWMPQPDKLKSLMRCETLMSGGLLARNLMAKIDLPPRRDKLDAEGVSDSVRQAWASLLADLITYRKAEAPHFVEMERNAVSALLAYQHELADRQEGDLRDCRPFAARWCENACRIALVLHAVNHGSQAHEHDLTADTAEAAITIMRWSSAQTLKVLKDQRDERSRGRKTRLKEILEDNTGRRTLNDCRRRNGFEEDEIRELVSSYPRVFKLTTTGKKREVSLIHEK
jgi:hypothetical protein